MHKTVKLSDLTSSREIAAGGEGKIYEHVSDKNRVIKVYHKARNFDFAKHLDMLSTLGPIFIKPIDIYIDSRKSVLGFDMQYVNFNDYHLFNNLFNKGFCSSHNIDKSLKLKILQKLKSSLEHIHQYKIVIGDLNQYNLFFNLGGDILFVDVDSYQTPDNPHSGVLLDDIRDWTTTDINDKTDVWAYDILAFWATTYCHPYKWVVPGNKESLEIRVRSNKSILSKIQGIKIPALYDPYPIDSDAHKQFMEIFTGRRYLVNLTGTYTPISTVVKQQIKTTDSLTIRKLYDSVSNIFACNNYFSVKIGREWRLIEANIPKVTRETDNLQVDELYPADSGFYAYKVDGYIRDSQGHAKFFSKNMITNYNGSYLALIDYDNDKQWNFNINNQLGGLDSTNTPIFARSIVKRNSLIQNFGSQKYINVPYLNRYMLVQVPEGTKDAIYVDKYIAVEFKKKNKVYFQIQNTVNQSFIDIDDDYLPHFAVVNDKTILVPEDGAIQVYYDLQKAMKFDCPMCTRDSKLFSTKAGILLFEDNIIYLLNTK